MDNYHTVRIGIIEDIQNTVNIGIVEKIVQNTL